MDMETPLSNGDIDGSVVMNKTEMDQPFSDNRQLVEDWNPESEMNDGSREINGLHQPKKLGMGFGKKECSRPTGGLAILISATIVFSVAVTVALIVQIYVGPHEVGQYGGVAADVPQCSQVGVNILQNGGSAVDAAIASLFCVGVVNGHNSGLGGGGFMLIHDHKTNKTRVIDFRETAPASASRDMFKGKPNEAKRGPRSVAVPGFLRGLEKAHALYGLLPWKQLVAPSIEIARSGFNVTKEIILSLSKVSAEDFKGPLREVYVRDGEFVKLNDLIKQPKLADTLEIIAENGPGALYEGDLADSIVKATNGEIALSDLKDYEAVERKAVSSAYKDKTILSMPAPGGGPTLLMILNIVEGFGWTVSDRNTSQMYNRLLEAFRFSYGQRPLLADPDFEPSVHNSSTYMIMKSQAKSIREKMLSYNGTKDAMFYLPPAYLKETSGTSHVSVSDSKELHVSATTSINSLFGSLVMTSTGIQLNNHMADFDIPGENNSLGLKPNSLNFPQHKKRPLSAMTPTIAFTTTKPCALRMALGASNGTRIITGVAETLINMFSFDMTLKDAIESPRVHDGLFDGVTNYEDGIPDHVISYLTEAGYNLQKITDGLSCVQAVMVSNDTTHAHSDSRKWGEAAILNNNN